MITVPDYPPSVIYITEGPDALAEGTLQQQINQRLAYPTPFVRRGYSCFILISDGR